MKNGTWRRVVVAVGVVIALYAIPSAYAENPAWGPWKKASQNLSHPAKKTVMGHLFSLYQEHISSDDGAACPFYPTCSAFAYQAITRHGFLYGGLLTLDRLTSEYPGVAKSPLYPLITVYGYHRPYDPVP